MKSLLDYTDRQQMSHDQSMTFISCVMAEKESHEIPKEISEDFAYKVMSQRLNTGNIPVSPWALAFLTTLCDRPATLVMYAYVCVEIHRKTKEEVTMNDITREFPMGFPSEKAMEECWDNQKGFNNDVDCDNILDTTEPWLVK